MKTLIILISMFLCTGFILKAELFHLHDPRNGNFSGVVTDITSGKPVEGATVFISDMKSGTTTNAKGEFIIYKLSEGQHLVEISFIGYTTIADKIFISGDLKKDYSLSESIIENNAVIVTGVTRATQLKQMPFQVSVMRKEDIFQSATSNIIEAISRKPGVYSLSTGPAIAKPLIRGLGYNRVLTINDGIRQEGQQWGDEHGIEVDEASVKKVEILKGPASLIYGSDAMAGVINIITNIPVSLNTINFNAGANYQSNNRLNAYNANFAGNVNGINWNLYGSTKDASDYKNKYDGRVFNSKFNERNFGGYGGYNGTWGFTHLLFSSFNLNAGLVEGERDSEGFFVKEIRGGTTERVNEADLRSKNPVIPYQNIIHNKIALDNNFKIGSSRLLLNAGWQRNQRREFGDIENPETASLYFDMETITYASSVQFAEKKGWKTTYGINGMKQINTNRGDETLIPNYKLFDFGTYLFSEKDLKRFRLSGGVRYDVRSLRSGELKEDMVVKTEAFNKTFQNISASAGLTFPVSKNTNFKFNIARAFRAPGISELTSNGAHEGTIRYEYGDKDLKSEVSIQSDAGIEYHNEHFSVNFAAYYNRFNNFIFYRKLQADSGEDSVVNYGGETLSAFKFDQRKATLTGVEITLDVHPHPLHWLHIQNTFSYVSGRLKEAIGGTNYLPFIPAPKLLTEVRADIKKPVSIFSNTYVKFEIENTFRQSTPFRAYDTETETPGYMIINTGAGSDIINKKGKVIFTINLTITNLADNAYQNHLSRLKYAAVNEATGRKGVFAMGRNMSLKINVPLTIRVKKE